MTAFVGRRATKPTDLLTLADLAERVAVISGATAYATTVGDGATRIFDLTHNLGTRDVVVSVYAATGNHEEVDADVWHLDANRTRIIFGAAPPAASFRVTILRAGVAPGGAPGGSGGGPEHGTHLYFGDGPPPDNLPGALSEDAYYDRVNGDLYQLV